jgi:hypothetical protein
MIIELDRTGEPGCFRTLLGKVAKQDRVKSILVLACDDNGFTAEQVDEALQQCSKPVFGGVFPQIIHGREKLCKGTLVAGLFHEAQVQVIHGLSDVTADYEMCMASNVRPTEHQTLFVFVDAFSDRISALVHDLFTVYGLEFNTLGGGAGSLNFQRKCCLFTPNGLIQDAAVLALLETDSGVGVCHGWSRVAGPFKVTEAHGNVIETLDWRPAFQVYRDVVEHHSSQRLTQENFFSVAKSYPFGIDRLGAEKVVRDPIKVGEKESLVCVGEVPQESYVHVLTGNVASLVGAAQMALVMSEESFGGRSTDRTILFIDCISRVLFLGDEFARELEAVSRDAVPLIGALTLGEIANNRKEYLEFYNKTAVVGVIQN